MEAKGFGTKHVVLHRAVDEANYVSLQNALASHTEVDPIFVDAPDGDGNTCLHKAAWNGATEICGILLEVFQRPDSPPFRCAPSSNAVLPAIHVSYLP